ncbi:hypothetical protein ACSFA8_20570 [Variovorax sp. RT4R15]|uniref:hypothetical protein n=1 Tax=Variovorax sp. RT4R15 TaxID=3443737 RepID=UPI003F451E25
MNPWLLLGALAFSVFTGVTGYVRGQSAGADRVIAKQVAVDQAIRDTRAAAQQGAADAIAQIKVTNTTVRGKTETIVRENVVYRDCRHAPDSVRAINAALTGDTAEPAGGGKLPAPEPVKR